MRIDCRKIANEVGAELDGRLSALSGAGATPTMAMIVATDDDGTAWYIRSLTRAATRLGIEIRTSELALDASAADISQALARASADPAIHGVICQTPLPGTVRLEDVASSIAPDVDIDGANPLSLGRLASGSPAFPPATAAAVLEILYRYDVSLADRRAVVVGRSNVVGKPVALLLLNEHATVTMCHSRTVDLSSATREADVLVATAGQAQLITPDHVKPGAIVIDVGTNSMTDGAMVGDVDTEAVEAIAGALTPVPGGVGPVTTMVLMTHLVTAAETRAGNPSRPD